MRPTRVAPPGQVLGVAGSGLVEADWAASTFVASLGRRGEVATAVILNEVARTPGGPTVLHHVQPDGSAADVDHVLVSGRRVYLLDSKVWKPAWYWSRGGTHRRSVSLLSHEPAEHVPSGADIARARRRIADVFEQHGRDVVLVGPIVVVWSSSEARPLNTWMLNLGGGASVVAGPGLRRAATRMARHGAAEAGIVAVLAAQLPVAGGRA